jgi:Tol biopolymer transport system component
MPLTPGTKLGPYEIVGPLGAGGMGEVYRAKDTRLGRDVAIKVLPESFSRDAERLHRFEQEARAVAALNHPNILAIYDIGEQGGSPFIVSELLEGHSLRVELENGPLTLRKATEYAVQIAQGLAAAHEKNIIHRDLKPDNVFLSKEGRAKILDFGLAKLAATNSGTNMDAAILTLTALPTEAGVVMGTVGYMAPEQVRGATVDSRTDIFAFGAVLYEMVSGRRAFQRDTAAETMTAILKEDPPELTDAMQPVSPGLERIIRRCLEKQPEQRFQSAKDLAFALEALSGTTTSKTMAAAAVKAEAKPRPWMAVALGAAIGFALAGAFAWFLRSPSAHPPTFTRVSFERGTVVRGRLSPDGKTVVFSGTVNEGPLETFVIRDDYPEAVSAGLHGAVLLAISRQGQMAVLIGPKHFAHFVFFGTLATAPMSGGAPRELLENVTDADFSPDGNEMAVIDTDPKTEKWRLQYPIGKILLSGDNWISNLRISPDGSQVAYFLHPPNSDDRGDVMLIDRSGNIRTLSAGWGSLEELAWAPSGKEIWFSGTELGSEYCLQTVTLSGKQRTVFCGTSSTRIHDIALTGRALVSADEGRVGMIVTEHGTKSERDLSWLDNVYNPRLSRDGNTVLFTDQSSKGGKDYSVYVRKADGSPAVRIGTGGYGTDLSPDGKWALITRGDDPAARVQIVPVGPGQPRILQWAGFQPLWAEWFADGQKILLAATEATQGSNMYVTDVSGTVPKLVHKGFAYGAKPAPDGQAVFFQKENDWFIISLADGKTKPIQGLKPGESPSAWAGDNRQVFTETRSSTGLTIQKLDLDTGKKELWLEWKPKDLVGLAPWKSPASLTPDGRWIALTYGTHVGQLYSSDTLK